MLEFYVLRKNWAPLLVFFHIVPRRKKEATELKQRNNRSMQDIIRDSPYFSKKNEEKICWILFIYFIYLFITSLCPVGFAAPHCATSIIASCLFWSKIFMLKLQLLVQNLRYLAVEVAVV